MNPKARITYRFDDKSTVHGKRQAPHAPASRPADDRKVVPLYPEELQFTQDVAPWNSPFQDDPYALERLIRETDSVPVGGTARESSVSPSIEPQYEPYAEQTDPVETASVPILAGPVPLAELKPSAFEAVPLGEQETGSGLVLAPDRSKPRQAAVSSSSEPQGPAVEDDLADNERDAGGAYTGYLVQRRRTGPSWLKVFASVAGALLTGALFGYVVLSLFADQAPASPANAADGSQTSAAVIGEADAASGTGANGVSAGPGSEGGTAAPTVTDASSLLTVELPERHYAMLQIGVFSSVEAMETAVADLKGKGYAPATDTLDGFRVYAGIAPDKTEAAALGEQLDVAELFVKTVGIPAASEIGYAGKAEEAVQFMNATDAFIRTAGDLSASMLSAGNPVPFADAESASWKDAYRGWSESAALAEKGTIAEHRDDYARLSQAIKGAAASLEAYEAGVSRAHLWQAQAQLMEAVFAWKEWMGRF